MCFSLQYPHLVYGAIASSAPVRAQVNFEDYNNVVTNSLGDTMVNGSTEVGKPFEYVLTLSEFKIPHHNWFI